MNESLHVTRITILFDGVLAHEYGIGNLLESRLSIQRPPRRDGLSWLVADI